MDGSVIVVGSVNVDIVVRVDRLPRRGETVTGGELSRHQGGKGANQAVAAARAGASVAFVGAVGGDMFGVEAMAGIASEDVDTGGVIQLSSHATGTALIVVDASGENQIAVAPGANAALDAATVVDALAGRALAEVVLLANLEVSDAAILAAATRVRDAGGTFVLNPAPASDMDPALLGLRPVLLPNAGESMALTGAADPRSAAERLRASTEADVAVTLGADGALAGSEGGVVVRRAYDVEPVDTTGAGDVFCGTVAAGLARGLSFVDAVDRAVAAASLSVRERGARTAPRPADVDALLRSSMT